LLVMIPWSVVFLLSPQANKEYKKYRIVMLSLRLIIDSEGTGNRFENKMALQV